MCDRLGRMQWRALGRIFYGGVQNMSYRLFFHEQMGQIRVTYMLFLHGLGGHGLGWPMKVHHWTHACMLTVPNFSTTGS